MRLLRQQAVAVDDGGCEHASGARVVRFCGRILPPLIRTTRSLAAVGDGGRFVRAKGAGHGIFSADPELVQETINDVLNDAK